MVGTTIEYADGAGGGVMCYFVGLSIVHSTREIRLPSARVANVRCCLLLSLILAGPGANIVHERGAIQQSAGGNISLVLQQKVRNVLDVSPRNRPYVAKPKEILRDISVTRVHGQGKAHLQDREVSEKTYYKRRAKEVIVVLPSCETVTRYDCD